MDKKSLKELCTIRDALKDLIVHGEWLGNMDWLKNTLGMIEYHIEFYAQYQQENFGVEVK